MDRLLRLALHSPLPAIALLILFWLLHGPYLPLSWPDEALFSSPAAELAAGRPFTTPVLYGLIPGMEVATLWNSPLYMVLLSLPYAIGGESQLIGRLLSLIIASATLTIFYYLALQLSQGRRRLTLTLTLLLAADLTFIKAANVIRMDILTLFWILVAIHFAWRWRSALAAGVATGLAAMSHPIAVLLVPLMAIFALSRSLTKMSRRLVLLVVGALVALKPWLFYILLEREIFALQFLSQLERKPGLMTLWGGETGGILVVFASQWGGGRLSMVVVLLWLTTILLCALFIIVRRASKLWQSRALMMDAITEWPHNGVDAAVRFTAAALVALAMVLVATEGWYALYIPPLLLLLFAAIAPLSGQLLRWPLALSLGVVMLLHLLLIDKHRLSHDTPSAIAATYSAIHAASSECNSLYLRYRPDPYFELRHSRPELELLQFVPGKLRFPNDHDPRRDRFESIDCFLLDPNHSWEPELAGYLEGKIDAREIVATPLPEQLPLERATLFQRKK